MHFGLFNFLISSFLGQGSERTSYYARKQYHPRPVVVQVGVTQHGGIPPVTFNITINVCRIQFTLEVFRVVDLTFPLQSAEDSAFPVHDVYWGGQSLDSSF